MAFAVVAWAIQGIRMEATANPLSKLRSIKKAINKEHGVGTMAMGKTVAPCRRIPTGSLKLDVQLGGGIPSNRVTMFWGSKSSGKSSTAYRIIGHAQNLCAHCYRNVQIKEVVESIDEDTGEVDAYAVAHCDCYTRGLFTPRIHDGEKIPDFKERVKSYEENSYAEFRVALFDIEGSYDFKWGEKLGVDSSRLLIFKAATAQEAVDIYDAVCHSGIVDMTVLDSIAQLTPAEEIENSAEKWQQGLQARLVNKLCRKAQSAVTTVNKDYNKELTQLWINQTRQKIGVMFGDPTTLPGGMGQEFIQSVGVKFWSSKYEVNVIDEGLNKDEEMKIADSVRINFKIEKNKTAPAKGTGSYVMSLKDGAVDEEKSILSLCEKYGEIRKEGTKWILGANEFKTKKEMIEKLHEPLEWARVTDLLVKKMLLAR